MKNQANITKVCVTLLFIAMISWECRAQERTHKGFYLSMQAGPAFGYINGNSNNQTSIEVSGTGVGFDLQIGGALKENLILHGTLGIKSIYGPNINDVSISKDYSFDEFMMGIGTTYYMAKNFFLTGNIGIGNFSFADESTNTTYDTGEGFSYQLKAGKEWWISPRWALGAAVEYSGTRTDDTMNNGYEESWQSHRFSVRFTATLNGKK
jgi:opacity protein-like surface antigen